MQTLFTPAALLSLLLQIEELKNQSVIGVDEDEDGNITVTIGESKYILENSSAMSYVIAPPATVKEIEVYNRRSYEDILNDIDSGVIDSESLVVMPDTVEAGIIKEVLKTLLIGGLVRLTGKLLR